ncbi:MAG: HD domain-containing protein [Candidatus Pacebacteria bacterium]|jgi:hypothetical protein|nr:HD domain-containing protein [Candidatus Paceibacterota bacterium]MBT4651946.1 HD domain-containing protein [Candidatus Paceibacterota bacterium]MBT6755968.1 HD domain-containing protein [Candidatus Paceibacterota bacterium]MBT6920839.1 HD domain-containing protein [Candidatus Paceibacterota bacterium]
MTKEAKLEQEETIEKKNISPSIEDLLEAKEWQLLFQQQFMTAHELSDVKKNHLPELEGAEYKVETEKLLKLKSILEKNPDDSEFREMIPEIKKLLPRQFDEMTGMIQHHEHEGYDPTEHTVNTLYELETDQLDEKDRIIARTAMIFHDVGKVKDPLKRLHPYWSAEIAKDFIKKMNFEPEAQDRILNHIRRHDALGDISREDGRNILSPNSVLSFFSNQTELEIHFQIVRADIKSIPKLSKYEEKIISSYNLLRQELQNDSDRKKPTNEANIDLPFEMVDRQEATDIISSIFEEYFYEAYLFKEIDITENQQERQNKFSSLSEEDKKTIEQFIIQESILNQEDMAFALKITGRETDEQYVDELEKKYSLELHNLRVAVYVFKNTYNTWWLKDNFPPNYQPSDAELTIIKSKVDSIAEAAKVLANFQVDATHATNEETFDVIDKSKALIKATEKTSTDGSQYEGNGVYTGILGGFDWWGNQSLDLFHMKLPLSEAIPIFINFNFPKAMANVLCEVLDIEKDLRDVAIPHGLQEYHQTEYNDVDISEWKLKILREILGTEVYLISDHNELPCVIADTDKDPILWGSICNVLRIRRFIPISSLLDYAIDGYEDKIDSEEPISSGPYFQEQEIKEWQDELIGKTLRIRGIKIEDIE